MVTPFELTLPSSRAFHFVCPRGREKRPNVKAFRDWIKAEMACLDFGKIGVGRDKRVEELPELVCGPGIAGLETDQRRAR